MSMSSQSLLCMDPTGFHRLAYTEWEGPPGARTVICAHGLTRTGRDFDVLAEALSRDFRVICPDMAGRGQSDWLEPPNAYGLPIYLTDVAQLVARLCVEEIIWIGTSMGGLIGMMLAARPRTPIKRLVMNDIGPVMAKEGIERIATYVGADPSFPDLTALEAYMREVSASFGVLSAGQWRHMAVHSARKRPDGTLGLHYDPRIAEPFKGGNFGDTNFWPQWDRITCPTMTLRGAESDLLRASDARAMTQRGPRSGLIEFAGIGHAPALMSGDQVAAVQAFLTG